MPPKSSMAKATMTTTRTTKRKAKEEIDDGSHTAATKRRRQTGTLVRSRSEELTKPLTFKNANKSADSEDDDAGFTFTRPAKSRKISTAPTRTSPRNLSKAAATTTTATFTNATPKATKPPAEAAFNGQSNNSDSFVALPVSDTPIIRKNQQLRQNGGDGRRRSSLSMRGKRASSIGNGFQSLPHSDIPASEFYKHISEDLPEPVRMKQLLAWCARRSIDESKMRPSLHGSETDEQIQASNIARTIEEEVLKDLIENKITTSWYHRPDQALDALEKKPHPQNVNNAAKLQEMEEKIAKLKAEEETWQQLLSLHTQELEADKKSTTKNPPVPEERFAKNIEQAVDLDLLPAQEAEFVHSLNTRASALSEDLKPTDEWLREAEATIELQVDTLLHGLHQQQQYLKRADQMGSQLLESAARAMATAEDKARTESNNRGIGMMDRLRQISRLE